MKRLSGTPRESRRTNTTAAPFRSLLRDDENVPAFRAPSGLLRLVARYSEYMWITVVLGVLFSLEFGDPQIRMSLRRWRDAVT